MTKIEKGAQIAERLHMFGTININIYRLYHNFLLPFEYTKKEQYIKFMENAEKEQDCVLFYSDLPEENFIFEYIITGSKKAEKEVEAMCISAFNRFCEENK